MEDPKNITSYDTVVEGSHDSREVQPVEDNVAIRADNSTIVIPVSGDSVHIFVGGEQCSVKIRGGEQDVTLVKDCSHTTIQIASTLNVTEKMTSESGHNSVEYVQDLVVVSDDDTTPDASELIETTRDEALSEATLFGVDKIEYQTVAEEADHCHGCGSDSDALVYQHSDDVLLTFGYCLSERETNQWMECEECSETYQSEDVELSEEEREEIFQ